MEIKTAPPVKVMFFTTRTSLEELENFVVKVAERLYAEITKQQLIPTGPQYWIYQGMDGNPATVFTLEIGVPVNAAPAMGSVFLFKELPAFACASVLHYGGWDELGKVYGTVIPALLAGQKQLSGMSRELYLNIDLENPAHNITEVQIGIR